MALCDTLSECRRHKDIVCQDHGINTWSLHLKQSAAHALVGVIGVASFITIDEQLK